MNRNSLRVETPLLACVACERSHALAVVGMDAVARELGLRRPLLRRVAEQRLDLRAHVERREGRLDAVHVRDERNVLDQGPVTRFGGRLLLLGLDDLGEIAKRAGEERSPASLELRDRELGGERRAVLPQRRQPQPLSHDPALAGAGGPGEPFLVTLPQFLGNDQVAQPAPDRLLAGPAERVLGGGVPLADDALVVHDDDAVERGVEHGFAFRCGFARPFDRAAQPDLGHHGGCEPLGDLDLSRAPLPRVAVDRAQHSDHLALCRRQRHAEVGADAELLDRVASLQASGWICVSATTRGMPDGNDVPANRLGERHPLSGRDLGNACDSGEDDLVRVAVGQRHERGRALDGFRSEPGEPVECLVLLEAGRFLKRSSSRRGDRPRARRFDRNTCSGVEHTFP